MLFEVLFLIPEFKCFPSTRPVAPLKCKSTFCPTIYPSIREE